MITLTGGKITLNFTADDQLQMFADGVEIPIPRKEAIRWKTVSVLHISSETRLIAVRANNTGWDGGILGSIENGIVTDETWKCSDSLEINWNQISFDDSNWVSATVLGSHLDTKWGHLISRIPSISEKAKWIWTSSTKDHSSVFCRKYIAGLLILLLLKHTH